ncbi:MAG: glycosyltransferase family 4 protein [Saprospiraceae bacterium]|nr:glycosyltransferase family 4 protein [Saprospiraceae bacterium]
MRQIKAIVEKYQIQLINAQSSKDRYTSILSRWRYGLNVKLVHTRRQTPQSVGGWLQNTFYTKGTDKIIVISEQLKKTFIRQGIPASHLEVIYNGVHPDFFAALDDNKVQALRSHYQLTPEDRVIGCVARLKKQDQLVRALQWLGKEVKLLLVGVEVGTFDELAHRLNLTQTILYAGKVKREELANYYALFDVFVLPSTTDGFGLVLIEAMGMGIPVIGTRSEGIIDVLENGKNGLLFEDGDDKGLADSIELIMNTPQVRNELIAAGRIAVQQTFTLERTIERYEQFFEALIGN